MKRVRTFRLTRMAWAVMLASAPATMQVAHAGAGWGDSALFDGTPIKRPTYFAHSPSGLRDATACFDRTTGAPVAPVAGGACDSGTPLAKFKRNPDGSAADPLPPLGLPGSAGSYISVAAPDTTSYPGTHYYELVVMESRSIRMHSDLAGPTTLRTYVQLDPVATYAHSAWAATHPLTGALAGLAKSPDVDYLNTLQSALGLAAALPKFVSQAVPLVDANGQPVMIALADPATHEVVKDEAGNHVMTQAYGWDKPTYLGSTIVALQGTPTRLKLYNGLTPGHGVTDPVTGAFTRNGDLPIPVDRSNPGAGDGPVAAPAGAPPRQVLASSAVLGPYDPAGQAASATFPYYHIDPTVPTIPVEQFLQHTQNRAELHLHGGDNPWVSDGHPHQWIAPAADELKCAQAGNPYFGHPEYCRGPIAYNVPDMPDAGPGAVTYFWPNGQSGRLMMFHDHATGLTRLNAYMGEAAGYVLADTTELGLAKAALEQANGAGSVNALDVAGTPLVIQDKTFVPKDIAQQDARWDTLHWGAESDLWYPHVYEPNQDPDSVDGTNPVGRWDWGAYFWPVFPSVYAMPTGVWGDETLTPEAWMDTPVVNGKAYPTIEVEPKTYRFRMLSVANDRFFNLGLYLAADKNTPIDGVTRQPLADTALASNGIVSYARLCDGTTPVSPGDCTEVSMVPFDSSRAANPALAQFPTSGGQNGTGWGQPDGRFGGVPDPATKGPDIVQIGNEAGLLAQPLVIPSTITNYEYNRRSVTVMNILERGLWLSTAERADVLIDFSQYAGRTLILYNDSPAPVPAGDPRLDFFTGMGDMTPFGGAPNPKPGFGPNTRTVMQFVVKGAPTATTANAAAAVPGTLRDNANNPYRGYAGSAISIASPVTVSQLGRWNIAGNGASHTVKLVDALTGNDVPGAALAVTMTSASSGSFQYAALPAPVTLQPGTYYLVSSEDTTLAAGDAFYDLNTTLTSAGPATVASAVWLSGPDTNVPAPQATWNPIGGAGNGYGPVDFKFTTAGTVTANPLDVNALKTAMANAYAATQPKPVVPQLAYNAPFPGLTATDNLARIYTGSIYLNRYQPMSFTTPVDMNYTPAPVCNSVATCNSALAAIRSTQDPLLPPTMKGLKHVTAGTAVSAYVENKAIQELFDPDYGRMNATLGVELPFTSALVQTTIPLAYVDPATETIRDGETQFWKITHNGVDTHPVHFHMLNVQVVNRVGWDGTLKPPLGDEIGWKETVRMHPLEDIIVAVRAKTNPMPFGLPYSSRMDAPHLPAGSNHGFTQVDPATGNPATLVNKLENYKYEYVWHCHILGHEENDFMRPFVLDPGVTLSPAPSGVAASLAGGSVDITWTDPTAPVIPGAGQTYNQVNAGIMEGPTVNRNEIGFRVERSLNGQPYVALGTPRAANVITNPTNTLANATRFVDPAPALPAPAVAPGTPSAVVNGATSVTLSWTMPAGVADPSGFDVLRSANGGAFVQVGATQLGTARSFTDTTAQPNTTYAYQVVSLAGHNVLAYRVAAVNAAGDAYAGDVTSVTLTGTPSTAASGPSSPVTTPVQVILQPPTNFTAQLAALVTGPDQVQLAWTDNSTAESGVIVQRCSVGACGPTSLSWATVATLPADATSVVHASALNNGTNYRYRVAAVNGASVGPFSAIVGMNLGAVPAAPANVTGTSGAAGAPATVELGWTDASNNNASFEIQRCTGNLTFCAVGSPNGRWTTVSNAVGANATSFSVTTGLTGGTGYRFRIRAVNPAGNSAYGYTPNVVIAQ